jgi:hypothetical protein
MPAEYFYSGKKPSDQKAHRRDLNPRDQFGRKWLLTIELVTGDPCGEVVPAGWSDPLRTPMNRVRLAQNEDGQIDPSRCHVDFDRWISTIEDDERGWYEELHRNALHVYKSVEPSDVVKLDQDKFLLDLTGPKPFPSSDILKRARAGDRSLLGLAPLSVADRIALRIATLEDLKVAPVGTPPPAPTSPDTPPDTYAAFVTWCFKSGAVQPGDLKAAAALWREHRAALSDADAA